MPGQFQFYLRQKYLNHLINKDSSFYIPENGAPSNFILKPNMAHFQFSIENECFCMMLANAVGLTVPPVMIVRKEDQKVLLIKRYDRILDIGNMDGHAKNLSFKYQAKQIRLAPFYDVLCTDIYDNLSQKLAMKIGGENRPEWITERHWKGFAEEIKVSHPILKKRLLDFCLKVTSKIDSTYADFINRHQQNPQLEDIKASIKKRSIRTLKQLNSTKK